MSMQRRRAGSARLNTLKMVAPALPITCQHTFFAQRFERKNHVSAVVALDGRHKVFEELGTVFQRRTDRLEPGAFVTGRRRNGGFHSVAGAELKGKIKARLRARGA